MASRSVFVFTILLSLVLVSCRPTGSSNTAKKMMIRKACRKTNDFRFCVSTLLKSYQRSTAADPKALTRILAERALSKVDEASAYVEKVFYYHPDMVVKEYLALCLDDYAQAAQKLRQIGDTLASGGDYKEAPKLLREIASHATDCQEAFERKKSQSELNYRPPRPCPLSRQNKIIQLMAEAAAGLLA
ncbi:cell wall / vacuolar inhibitor of fructosidase 2-like [Phoenix dactylifera]|uniref:Cell wall / vacuolar inhibitor of fructosidase 2-like n=1 Tax=Phoenix dactylifera TaxID=42345 RepID=A0A8B7CBU3_PHODC|nr:cell wall / vacuolar inhibitor of fructosidase 2-like [Phoenix dactylifera]